MGNGKTALRLLSQAHGALPELRVLTLRQADWLYPSCYETLSLVNFTQLQSLIVTCCQLRLSTDNEALLSLAQFVVGAFSFIFVFDVCFQI
jgi:hypothetical protein